MNAPTPPTAGPLTFGFNPHDDMNDLRMSEKATPLYEHVKRFIAESNGNPKLFVWTADPDCIIQAAKRVHQALDSKH